MDCKIVEEKIIDYMSGDISGSSAEEIATHLQQCDNCRKEAIILRKTMAALKNGYSEKSEEELSVAAASIRLAVRLALSDGHFDYNEGIAIRASDVDVVWVYGYGWPRYRGGPMHYADSVGLDKIVATLRKYQEMTGSGPSPMRVYSREMTIRQLADVVAYLERQGMKTQAKTGMAAPG